MAGRVDAIDPRLSRERVVSRRAGRTAGCTNRNDEGGGRRKPFGSNCRN